ncbi:OLC1v1006103C1 [Oldenlandia corymbosa var. corymbosa]|uniref:OLC1v1006103C1 n=1 Tax=Oldenlandia corymbosa var. corymbosa TaxID=529605 RepID=A0AAV1DIA9_OLDCO|nr:OLC1v1006103C1 [Oldenlandia corymbosa var. corymbosa]
MVLPRWSVVSRLLLRVTLNDKLRILLWLKERNMGKEELSFFHFRSWCYILVLFSTFSSISFLYWSQCSNCCDSQILTELHNQNQSINLLSFPFAWNRLNLASQPPPALLKIALFVKKWPENNRAGGLERHALTLHHALAKRGHELHIFTTSPSSNSSFANYPVSNMIFHLSKPSAGGFLDQAEAWRQFQAENSTGRPFDVIHTESVGLMHTRSRNQSNVAVSWHGIAYESIHSDIIQELHRPRNISQSKLLTERVMKVIEEVKFFPNYAHHVATSDHAGDVLKRIYLIPDDRVHIILNGVDQELFKPNAENGERFKSKYGIPESKKLIIGLAGRLVKDKGHPLMFETLRQMFKENSTFRDSVTVVVVGDGPWVYRYKLLGSNLRVFGAMEQAQLADFYNAMDVFVNPTLRAQGLDHTLLEALLTGKPLMATKLASITGSVVVNEDFGYIFSPTVRSLKKALYKAYDDGREVLERKGQLARERGLNLFTATKMAAAYERLFLCISKDKKYRDHCSFQPPRFTTLLEQPT